MHHESVQLMLDALLSYPPRREFNKTELAEQAGVSRQSVGNHIDLLLRLEIIDLNGRINAVGEADEMAGNE